jgi:hypothetical protein
MILSSRLGGDPSRPLSAFVHFCVMGLAGGKLSIVVVTALTALVVASCGGGDDESATSDSTAVAQGQGDATGDSPQDGKEGSSKSGESRDGSGGSAAKEHDDSGGGSAQFKTKGGDNSVQEFGEEGSDSEFEQAAAAVHGFLDAREERDWEAVCSNLAASVTKGLKALAGKSEKLAGAGCVKIMGTILANAPESAFKGEAAADIGSLRVEGDRAFVIYRAGDDVLAMSMKREDGTWKVATLAGTPIN